MTREQMIDAAVRCVTKHRWRKKIANLDPVVAESILYLTRLNCRAVSRIRAEFKRIQHESAA